MKKLLLLLCLLCPLLFLPSGCKGNNKPTAEAVVYQTLRTTQIAVDAAMQSYGVLVRAGKVDLAKQNTIDTVHETFRTSFIAAAKLAKQDWSTLTPVNVLALQNELLALVSKLN